MFVQDFLLKRKTAYQTRLYLKEYSRSYAYVPLPFPSRYRCSVTVTHRRPPLPTVTDRYGPFTTVTDRYRILPLLALQALPALH